MSKISFVSLYLIKLGGACRRQILVFVISRVAMPMADEGEICLFEEISPRKLVEMTALMDPSVISSSGPFQKKMGANSE